MQMSGFIIQIISNLFDILRGNTWHPICIYVRENLALNLNTRVFSQKQILSFLKLFILITNLFYISCAPYQEICLLNVLHTYYSAENETPNYIQLFIDPQCNHIILVF